MDMTDLSALLGEDMSAEANADIWVVLPGAADAAGAKEGAALLGEARRLADTLGCYVQAVVGGEAAAQAALAFGADRVHVSQDAIGTLDSQRPEFVFFPASHTAVAAGFAERHAAGLVTGVRDALQIDPETRALIGTHWVYDGEYGLESAVTAPVKVATIEPGFLPMPSADATRTGSVEVAEVPAPAARVHDLGPATDYEPPAWRPLSKAAIIVSVGRGLRDEAGVEVARQLAGALGAELAGDRSALASGWIDEAHEVGVTGEEVAPDVYIAVGITGDTIHNAAIAGARRVIAVHRDANAPIFKVADMGVVAEPKEFVTRLLEVMRES